MIKLLILDVDGVLTTGELPYSATGNEVKSFNVLDGMAIKLWQAAGGRLAIISGRQTPAVEARAKDLGIDSVRQGVIDKLPAYEAAVRDAQATDAETAVIGDDLPELPMLRRCGYPVAVANATPAAKRASRYITRRRGGDGAVAEAIERLLRENGTWSKVTARWNA